MHMNGANLSTTFSDESVYSHNVQAIGNAKLSIVQSKFGGTSAYFDGLNSSGLKIVNAAVQNIAPTLNSDFTIEAWVYPQKTDSVLIGNYWAPGSWLIGLVDGQVQFTISGTTTATVLADSALPLNTWTHVAVCRASGILRIFYNGVVVANAAISNRTYYTNPAGLGIGVLFMPTGTPITGSLFQGYIDELRITRVALYRQGFPLSNQPFTDCRVGVINFSSSSSSSSNVPTPGVSSSSSSSSRSSSSSSSSSFLLARSSSSSSSRSSSSSSSRSRSSSSSSSSSRSSSSSKSSSSSSSSSRSSSSSLSSSSSRSRSSSSSSSSSSSRSLSSSSSSSASPPFCPDCGGIYIIPSSSSSSSSESGCLDCDNPSSSSSSSSSSSLSNSSSSSSQRLATQAICATDAALSTNIATINGTAGLLVNKRISIEFKITPSSANNAGLVLNYTTPTTTSGAKYLLVAVNADNGTFSLLRYNGTNFVLESVLAFNTIGFLFDFARWYKLSATVVPIPNSDNVLVLCDLEKMDTGQVISISSTLSNYGALTGSCGLFTDRSYTYFDNLKIE